MIEVSNRDYHKIIKRTKKYIKSEDILLMNTEIEIVNKDLNSKIKAIITSKEKVKDIYIYSISVYGVDDSGHLELILEKACEYMNVDPLNAKKACRKQDLKDTRQIYMCASYELTNNSLQEIAGIVNQNHCSVIHARKRISEELDIVLVKKYNEFKSINKSLFKKTTRVLK